MHADSKGLANSEVTCHWGASLPCEKESDVGWPIFRCSFLLSVAGGHRIRERLPSCLWQPLERQPQQRGQQRQLLVQFAQYEQRQQRVQLELQFGQLELEQQQPQQRTIRARRAPVVQHLHSERVGRCILFHCCICNLSSLHVNNC